MGCGTLANMRKWGLRLLIIGLMIGAVYALKVWVWAPAPISVSTVAVERGRVEETVTNSRAGTVKARRRANLSPEIGGRIVEIPYRKGSTVRAGEVLLRLNDESQRAAVQMAERDLAVSKVRRERACLEAARAKREFVRHQQLEARDLVSTDLLDKLENVADSRAILCKETQAAIARAQSVIVEAEAELSKTVLVAPFNGIIAELDVEVGEWTTPSPPALPVPPVLDLIDPSSIYVSAPMDEVDSSRIQEGQPVRITLDPFPDRHFSGQVHHLAPYVLDREEQNRTVEIEVEFSDESFATSLLPGTSSDVEVILSVKDQVLRLPTSTLFEGTRVFIIEDHALVVREVTTGLKNWDFVEIVEGLEEGDEVVSSLDVVGLTEGAPVEVRPAAARP